MSTHNYYKVAEMENKLSQQVMRGFTGFGDSTLPLDHAELHHIPYARNAGKVAPAGQYRDHVGALTRGDDYVSRSAVKQSLVPHVLIAGAFIFLLFLRK